MLVDQLLGYLTRVVPDAKLSTYKDLLPFLYELDPGVFEMQFNQFTAYLDEFTTADNVAQFDATVVDLLAEGVEEFGFFLTDTLPIHDKMTLLGKICRALYRVDQFEDLLSIKYAMEVAESPREKIADVLHLVDNTLDTFKVMELCKEVSPSLIYRLRDYLSEMEYRFPEAENEEDTALLERVKTALNFFGVERAARFFKDGGRIGESLTNYLDYYYSDQDGEASPDVLARLALFSAVAANIPFDQIKERVGNELPNYFTDPKALLALSRMVNKTPLPETLYAQA